MIKLSELLEAERLEACCQESGMILVGDIIDDCEDCVADILNTVTKSCPGWADSLMLGRDGSGRFFDSEHVISITHPSWHAKLREAFHDSPDASLNELVDAGIVTLYKRTDGKVG